MNKTPTIGNMKSHGMQAGKSSKSDAKSVILNKAKPDISEELVDVQQGMKRRCWSE